MSVLALCTAGHGVRLSRGRELGGELNLFERHQEAVANVCCES